MEQVLERQVVGARSSSWFSSGSVPAEPWHPWGVDASVECGWIPKESADTIWGSGLEDFGLIRAAYLLILILLSIRVFKFLKVVPYLLLKGTVMLFIH